jgi:eukaryotic-like serine/threonine-protein kinase
MTLAARTKLGPYEIIGALGAGGMGEVYRGRDPRLGRDVALKVLPAALAQDGDRMSRFQREAQVLASLNHPNIAAIHGLEEASGVRALVMELVEGPTLAERIKSARIPLEETLHIAGQIAEALEAAHERGIIHRDLKPANIKVTPEGTVKVLDFGLAKALDTEASASNISNSPTLTEAATQPGVILGTAAYMSPEQAKGKSVDRRADIWAFGCVLYEMLTGRRAFEGEATSETLAAVIKSDPNWEALSRDIPANIRRLLERCLDKDPKRRLQAIGEVRIAIEDTLGGTLTAGPGLGPTPTLVARGSWLLWTTITATVTAAALALLLFLRPSTPAERRQFTIPIQTEISNLALSADGRMLAFVARDDASGNNMLYFERLGSPTAEMLAGTESAAYPFWSPDDAYLGFFASGKLKKVAVSGSTPQLLAAASYGRGGSWGSKGVIIYAPETRGPLWRVNADGANPAPLTEKLFLSSETSHRWPVFLPDGDHFLFWSGTFGSAVSELKNGIYRSSLAAKEKQLVMLALSNPGYANGHLYRVDDRKSLIAVPFDIRREAVSGEPMVVAEHVTYQPSVLWGAYGVGGNDTIIYNTSTGATLSILAWYDRTGKELGRVGEPGVMANPSISPDGKRATLDIADLKSNNVDIWIDDLDHETSSRFTFDPAEEATGVWSRDGKLVAYRSIAGGSGELVIKKASGVEAQKEIYSTAAGGDIMPNSWAPDDKQILCSYQPAAGGSDLVVVNVATGKMTPLVATKASETNGQNSPDGKWVAYASNESGDWEIYVATFPSAQGKWQVSRGGGTEPRWRADGKEIFYMDPKGMLTAVPVMADGTFSPGAPSPLFQTHGRSPISSTDVFTYDVTKDGKRFLVNRYVKPDRVQPLTVVLNAAAEMKK